MQKVWILASSVKFLGVQSLCESMFTVANICQFWKPKQFHVVVALCKQINFIFTKQILYQNPLVFASNNVTELLLNLCSDCNLFMELKFQLKKNMNFAWVTQLQCSKAIFHEYELQISQLTTFFNVQGS